MKYSLLILLLLNSFTLLSQSDEKKKHSITIGIKNGLILSDFRKLSLGKITALRMGFTSGIQVDVNFNPYYSLGLGVQYVDKGYTVSEYFPPNDKDLDQQLRIKFQTIEFPFLSTVKFNILPKVKFIQTLGLGLEFWGFKKNEEPSSDYFIYGIHNGTFLSPHRFVFTNTFHYDKKVGFNLIAGSGVEINISELLSLGVTLTYQLGLDKRVIVQADADVYYSMVAFYPRSYLSLNTILWFKFPHKIQNN